MLFHVRHMDPVDGAVEPERCLVVVVERNGRPERDADVEALVGPKNAMGQVTGTMPSATTLAIFLHRHVERAARHWTGHGSSRSRSVLCRLAALACERIFVRCTWKRLYS